MEIFGYTISEEEITAFALLYGTQLVAAVVIFIVGLFAAKFIRMAAVKVMERARLERILINFLSKILYTLILMFVIIAALGKLGVQTASLVAVLGAAGLAIGLALQGSLSNFAAGIMIIVLKHFKLGDVISTDKAMGVVKDMNIFTTTLDTFTNERVIIPNSILTSNVLTNLSSNFNRRVDLVFGVGYNDDLDRVSDILTAIIAADERIFTDPEPFVGVDSLGDNSVNFVIRVWTRNSDWGNVRHDLLKIVKQRFDKEGISIPFPQREMQIHLAEDARQILMAKQMK